jgi:hypothetical protein
MSRNLRAIVVCAIMIGAMALGIACSNDGTSLAARSASPVATT